MTIGQIRKIFPVLGRRYHGKKIIYFDNACSALKSRPMIGAVKEYYEKYGACAGSRSSHYLSAQVNERCEETREAVRRFIGARWASEIIWTKNATEALNLVARSFSFGAGKNEVVLTNFEHHSSLLPYYLLAQENKIKLKIFQLAKNGDFDLGKFSKFITKKTALVAAVWASNVIGRILPASEIIEIAHQQGALAIIDASQYLPTHRVDTEDLGADFLAFSGHKLGGPTGLGVLYARREIQPRLNKFLVGGGTVKSVKLNKQNQLAVDFLAPPACFEAGIQPYASIFGLKAAIDLIDRIGCENITRHVSQLSHYLAKRLKKISGVKIVGQKIDPAASLVSFYFTRPGATAEDFNIYLNSEVKNYLIAIRTGHYCAQPASDYLLGPGRSSIRASFFIYNTREEVDIFLAALKQYLKLK